MPQNSYVKELKRGRDGQQATMERRIQVVSKKSAANLPFGRIAVADPTIPNDQGVKLPAASTDITEIGMVAGITMPTQFLESQAAPNADPPEYYLFPANILQRGPTYAPVEVPVKTSDPVYVRFQANAAPANEVQTYTPNAAPTAGDYNFSFRGIESPQLIFNAGSAAILAALQEMMSNPELFGPELGPACIGSVTGDLVTGGGPLITVTFGGTLGDQEVDLMLNPVNTLTYNAGANPVVITPARQTPGHTAGNQLGILTNNSDGGTCALLATAEFLTSGNPQQNPVVELSLTRT